jgi:hypothetical protein
VSDPSSPQSAEQPPNPYGQPPSPPQYGAQPTQPYGQPYQPYQPAYPQAGYAQPGYPQPGYPQPGFPQPAYPAHPAYQGDPDRRPGTITAAGIVTIILAGLTLLFGLLLLAVGASGSESFADSFREGAGGSYDDISDDGINNLMIGIGAGLAVWCVAAIVLAIFTMRRSNAARVLLVISASACGVLSLIAILSVISIVTLIGAIAVVVLVFVGGANDWYARRVQPMPVGTTQPWS